MAADVMMVAVETFCCGDGGMTGDEMTDSSIASFCLWDGICHDVCCYGGDGDGLHLRNSSAPYGKTSS